MSLMIYRRKPLPMLAFHLAIYEASHNQVLIRIMQQFIRMMSEDVFYERTSVSAQGCARQFPASASGDLSRHRRRQSRGGPRYGRRAPCFDHGSAREAQRADARLEVALRRQQGAKLVTGKVK